MTAMITKEGARGRDLQDATPLIVRVVIASTNGAKEDTTEMIIIDGEGAESGMTEVGIEAEAEKGIGTEEENETRIDTENRTDIDTQEAIGADTRIEIGTKILIDIGATIQDVTVRERVLVGTTHLVIYPNLPFPNFSLHLPSAGQAQMQINAAVAHLQQVAQGPIVAKPPPSVIQKRKLLWGKKSEVWSRTTPKHCKQTNHIFMLSPRNHPQ